MGSTATSTSAVPGGTAPAAGRARFALDWVAATVVAGPELVAVALAGFSIGPIVLLLVNHFAPGTAILTGLLGAVLALVWYGRPERRVVPADVLWTLLALLFVYGWIVLNGHYVNQDVYAIRDPSTYATAGRWLMDHHSLSIQTHPEIFGQSPTSRGVTSGGFNNIRHEPTVWAQGNHLLPVLIALAGHQWGQSALFSANIAFGGLAMFVFFGLARKVLRSGGLAFLATVVLGLSVPMIYVSRDTFSEPLTMLFLMGGLALVYRAGQSGRPRDYALAAFVAACSAMLRIDSYASLVGFIAAAAIVCVTAPATRTDRRRAVWCAVAVLVGGAGPTLLGWLDVASLSQQYYWAQHGNVMSLIKLLFALCVLLPIVVSVGWWSRVRTFLRRPTTRRRVGTGAIVALVAAFVALATRPWWYVPKNATVNPNLQNLERTSGLPADGVRTYGDQTVHWMAMYLGWPTVVLAVVGYAVLVHRFVRRREYALAGPLATALALSALYLWNPQIYPDQPWAMRRYSPVVLPMLLIAAMVGLRLLAQLAGGRVRLALAARALPWTRRGAAVLVVVSAVALLVVPIAVLRPVWKITQEGGQYPQLAALCETLPENAAVIETDQSAQTGYGQALRAYCDVPSFGLPGATQEQLAAASAAVAASGRTLYALASGPDAMPYAPDSGPQVYSTVTTTRWTTHIGKVPSGPRYDCVSAYLATVDTHGLAHTVVGGPVNLVGPCAG